MPIKFRCEHCQQLLGISRSRAAANVDCPQCGRTLKVPGDPAPAALSAETAQSSEAGGNTPATEDENLMSALTQLTMLADEADSVAQEARPFDDSSTVIQGQDAPSERLHRNVSGPETTVTGSAATFEASADTTEALQDLASWQEPASPSESARISTELLSEMRSASTTSSWLASTLVASLLILISGAAGWWLARSGTVDSWLGVPSTSEVTSFTPGDDTKMPVHEHLPVAVQVRPDRWVATVKGRAYFIDESDQTVPDKGAAVYFLPETRDGNLKIHARSFQKEPTNADRRFSEAALQALGGFRVEADDEGRFEVGSHVTSDQYRLIVVSRHRERPDQALPDSQISNELMPWFDSTIHILGQRDAVMRTISESAEDVVVVMGE